MNTAFLLMAQYGGKAVIPIEDVCRDYFRHMTPAQLARKATAGEIDLPITRIETSQKPARRLHRVLCSRAPAISDSQPQR